MCDAKYLGLVFGYILDAMIASVHAYIYKDASKLTKDTERIRQKFFSESARSITSFEVPVHGMERQISAFFPHYTTEPQQCSHARYVCVRTEGFRSNCKLARAHFFQIGSWLIGVGSYKAFSPAPACCCKERASESAGLPILDLPSISSPRRHSRVKTILRPVLCL